MERRLIALIRSWEGRLATPLSAIYERKDTNAHIYHLVLFG